MLDSTDELLNALADVLTPKIAERLRKTETEYVDQTNAPGFTSAAYLKAARRGAFPSTRVGRKVMAKREDVVAYLQSKGKKGVRKAGSASVSKETELDEKWKAIALRAGKRGVG